ncbi:MAG: hypothetical protein MMC23_008169 [Stictis urceolatum]|nr:hypothetical protein [Stictis urceolata]
MAIVWETLCWQNDRDPTKLRYVIRNNIVNGDAVALIDEALGKAGSYMQPWPGKELSIFTMEGRTLLGTPNGYGVGFMLMDHWLVLGHLKVKSVTAFINDAGGYSLMFNLTP